MLFAPEFRDTARLSGELPAALEAPPEYRRHRRAASPSPSVWPMTPRPSNAVRSAASRSR